MTNDALVRVVPGQFGSEDAVRGLMRRDLEGSPDTRPRISVSSQPAAGIIGSLPKLDLGLSKPKPASDAPVAPMVPQPREMSLEAAAPPPPSEAPAPYRGVSIGPSVKGLGDTERGLVLRDALRTADPTSRVRIQGDQVDIAPPEKPGRSIGFSAALEALATADPENPMQALGRGIGGLLTGAISPRSGAKINRRFELDRLENDIQRGLKLDANQAQVEQMQLPKLGQMSTRILNEGEYPDLPAGTEVRTRIDPRTGAITDVMGPNNKPVIADLAKPAPRSAAPHYEKDAEGYLISVQDGVAKRVSDANGAPVRVKTTGDDGSVQEIEINGRTLKVTDAQALNYFAQVGAQETKRTEAENEARTKRTAKLNESSSYYRQADGLMAEAKKLYGQPDPYGEVARKISELENEARGLYTKSSTARAEAEQIPEPPRRYSGRTMSQASLAKYAKDNSLSVEEARKKVEAEGVRVQ